MSLADLIAVLCLVRLASCTAGAEAGSAVRTAAEAFGATWAVQACDIAQPRALADLLLAGHERPASRFRAVIWEDVLRALSAGAQDADARQTTAAVLNQAILALADEAPQRPSSPAGSASLRPATEPQQAALRRARQQLDLACGETLLAAQPLGRATQERRGWRECWVFESSRHVIEVDVQTGQACLFCSRSVCPARPALRVAAAVESARAWLAWRGVALDPWHFDGAKVRDHGDDGAECLLTWTKSNADGVLLPALLSVSVCGLGGVHSVVLIDRAVVVDLTPAVSLSQAIDAARQVGTPAEPFSSRLRVWFRPDGRQVLLWELQYNGGRRQQVAIDAHTGAVCWQLDAGSPPPRGGPIRELDAALSASRRILIGARLDGGRLASGSSSPFNAGMALVGQAGHGSPEYHALVGVLRRSLTTAQVGRVSAGTYPVWLVAESASGARQYLAYHPAPSGGFLELAARDLAPGSQAPFGPRPSTPAWQPVRQPDEVVSAELPRQFLVALKGCISSDAARAIAASTGGPSMPGGAWPVVAVAAGLLLAGVALVRRRRRACHPQSAP